MEKHALSFELGDRYDSDMVECLFSHEFSVEDTCTASWDHLRLDLVPDRLCVDTRSALRLRYGT